jgi:hypothetical protein
MVPKNSNDECSTNQSIEFQDSEFGDGKLILPDGQSIDASTISIGDCKIAAAMGNKDLIAVFVDGDLSFTINEYVKIMHPLARSIAVTEKGYISYLSGEHKEKVFNLVTWHGNKVLQRVVDSARPPKFTPGGGYVAFWRLSDNKIYSFDVDDRDLIAQFNTEKFRNSDTVGRAVNIGLSGVEYGSNPAFEVRDTYGQGEDEKLGYISPYGEIIETLA